MIDNGLKRYIESSFRKGKIVCLTGAGISAESGIPVFRGKGGLWEKYDPEVYANTEGLIAEFKNYPQGIADFLIDFYSVLLKAKPNPAHLALAALEKQNLLTAVITQNIDNLHQEAGSRNVIELHGNASRVRCVQCRKNLTLEKDRLKEMLELIRKNRKSRIGLLRVLSRYFPRCKCRGRFRTDVVLFGEMLPEQELSRAYEELNNCKILLLVGSSLVVYPAANLPIYAKQKGVRLIEINKEPSALSDICDYKVRAEASSILPEILNILTNA